MVQLICITEGCNKPMNSRGLCSHCYREAKKLIDLGMLTWKQLEKRGRSLPVRGIF